MHITMNYHFDSLKSHQQKELMSHFQSTATNKFLASKALRRYLAISRQLEVNLGIQNTNLRAPVLEVFTELSNLLIRISSTNGKSALTSFQFFDSPLDFVIDVTSNAVLLKAQKLGDRSNQENIDTLVTSKREEVQILTAEAKCGKDAFEKEADPRRERLLAENKETLEYTLQILRDKLIKLKEEKSNLTLINMEKPQELIQRLAQLKKKSVKLSNKLESESLNGTLPSNLNKIGHILAERQFCLKGLQNQIESLNETNTSIFLPNISKF